MTIYFIGFVIGAISGSLLILHMNKLANDLEVTKENISIPFHMKNKRVLFISDIHRRKIEERWLKDYGSFDYVIIGGDLVEKGTKEDTIKSNFSLLCSLGKVIFVWGNNDYEYGEESLKGLLSQFNVTALENETIVFEEEQGKWSLVGIGDYGTLRTNMEQAFYHATGPVVLVSHNPYAVETIHEDKNIIAVLSGHTHGGQIRFGPFGIAEKGGWKKVNKINVFISNGFGTRKIPLRLGVRPQVHIITIQGI